MLLAIDIGNSLIKFGIFENEKLVNRFTIPTNRNALSELPSLIRRGGGEADGVVEPDAVLVSSVVPELENVFREFSEKHLNVEPLFVDHTFDFGLKINYTPLESLGIDRLVAAFAAVEKYGKPCIVCDFGTATTIDAVNERSEYLGGIITPGMNMMAEALHQKTSKLLNVEIRNPESIFGSTTVGSIQSGIFYGYIGLVEGILMRMIHELGVTPKVVATGGFANLMADSSKLIDVVDENLILEGLRMLHERITNS